MAKLTTPITLEGLRELRQIIEAAQGMKWADQSHGYRTDIGFWTKDIDQHEVFVPLFETRQPSRRADVLAVVYAHNMIVDLIDALETKLGEVYADE